MEFIVLGIEAVPGKNKGVDVVDVAAVYVGKTGSQEACFQSYVNPGKDIFTWGCPEAIQALGACPKDLEDAPEPAAAAEGLRRFLELHPVVPVHAFNLDRVKKLLGAEPWRLDGRWGVDLRACVARRMDDESGPSGREVDPRSVKLYQAAQYMNIPVSMKRYALADALVAVEILGKLAGPKDTIGASDRSFLWEAAYLMEDGF